eukprot:CAMPEP_0202438098 /NCGR_PEP_ID=MMETSP1345-20130828/32395_1 /ASSEMBLY_ACC=CAM_ASM_000843 /TAXON_ID=342563 /ORGANISM="Fabrea Fabrea salina" /LENGTH=364 /DNA_ID=CAMNT_0049052169 /DNA_START=210 /DNA_END=1301 /DNA_ORIENTATION=-
MELLAVVTVYSCLRWEVKVKLGVYMSDFDGDKYLSKDELTVLVSSFFEGLSKVTENPSLDQFTLRNISKALMKATAPAQTKKVQSNELISYAEGVSELLEILRTNQPSISLSHSKIKSKYLPEIRRNIPSHSPIRDASPLNLSKNQVSKLKLPSTQRLRTNLNSNKKLFIITKKNKHLTFDYVKKLKSAFEKAGGFESQTVKIPRLISFLHSEEETKSLAHSMQSNKVVFESQNITLRELIEYACFDCDTQQIDRIMSWIEQSKPQTKSLTPKAARSKNRMDLETAREFKKVFDKADTNRDGGVDIEEMKSIFGESFENKKIERIFKRYDLDKNNKLDFGEFLKMIAPKNVVVPDSLLTQLQRR